MSVIVGFRHEGQVASVDACFDSTVLVWNIGRHHVRTVFQPLWVCAHGNEPSPQPFQRLLEFVGDSPASW